MNKIIDRDRDGRTVIKCGSIHTEQWNKFVDSMVGNNTFCPGIERVIFNLKTTETKPVLGEDGKPVTDEKGRVRRETVPCSPSLATVVYFDDGTKVSVVNSDADVVKVVRREVLYFDTDKSGKRTTVHTNKFIDVAADSAKEAGVVYAIVKRIYGKVGKTDKTGHVHENEIDGNGFGRKLRDLTSIDMPYSYDTQYEAAFNDVMKVLAKKEHDERQRVAQENRAKRRPSLEANIDTLVKQNAELLKKLTDK